MKLKSLVAGAVLSLCTFTVFAADPKKPDMDPAMMDAMMKAGQPGDAHKALNPFVGKWNTKVTFWMMPGSDPMVTTGMSENKWVMGGRYLEQRFNGTMMGAPFEGMGVTGYDNVKKQYWGTWMDNMSTGMMSSTGSASSDGKTFTFTATMADPMTGKDASSEEKITIVDANHHTMEMWGAGPDGKNFKMMEIQYTRQ
jgi:hypothetical protein